MKCGTCSEGILPGSTTFRITVEKAELGAKSGLLGSYPVGDDSTVVHPMCAAQAVSVDGNGHVQDDLQDHVREMLASDLNDELREEWKEKFNRVVAQVAEHDRNWCQECWDKLEEAQVGSDEPPEPHCLWCKSNDQVWTKVYQDGLRFCCFRCGKFWNEREEEIVLQATG